MATFKTLTESDNIDGRYSERKRVYLESDDDLAIFERWFFDEGEFIEFKSSDEGMCGGCTRVNLMVDKDRESGILSFGIVDRDALKREQKWDIFWESDNEAFLNVRPFGEYIRPLCRWEIENYLLEPGAVEALLSDYGSYSPNGIDKSRLSKKLLAHAEALVPIMVVSICLHNAGKKELPQQYGIDENKPEPINAACKIHLEKLDIECKFEDIKSQVFSFKNGDNALDHFWSLSRIIDGKRLNKRFEKEFGLKEDHRFHLAKLVREKGAVAPEIRRIIQEFKDFD